jgi:hypothetical protein
MWTVEHDVFAALLGEAARQSGFSRLPRTANCDDSSVTQSGADLGLGNAANWDQATANWESSAG